MSDIAGDDTKFFVHLRGLKLPEDVTKRIESQIQQIIKDEIAKLDISKKGGLELEDDTEYRNNFTFSEELGPASLPPIVTDPVLKSKLFKGSWAGMFPRPFSTSIPIT